jgi:hypothetical protein
VENSLSNMYYKKITREDEEDGIVHGMIFVYKIGLFLVGAIVAGYYVMSWFLN